MGSLSMTEARQPFLVFCLLGNSDVPPPMNLMTESGGQDYRFLVILKFFFRRAHENWDLPEPPEIVTFAKKMLVGGYYFKDDFLPKHVSSFQNFHLVVF